MTGAELETVGAGGDGGAAPRTVRRQGAGQSNPNDPATWGKVPRNAPCPCGSGKKYKHCHGKLH
jgi:preprotein translocase subunit SecA